MKTIRYCFFRAYNALFTEIYTVLLCVSILSGEDPDPGHLPHPLLPRGLEGAGSHLQGYHRTHSGAVLRSRSVFDRLRLFSRWLRLRLRQKVDLHKKKFLQLNFNFFLLFNLFSMLERTKRTEFLLFLEPDLQTSFRTATLFRRK